MAHNRCIFLSDRHHPSPVISARGGARPVGPEGAAVLQLHLALAVLAGTTITLVWAATGNGDFWPLWVWLALGGAFATHAGIRWAVVAYPPGRYRRLAIHVVVSAVLAVLLVLVWLVVGPSGFWPSLPLLGLGVWWPPMRCSSVVAPAPQERGR